MTAALLFGVCCVLIVAIVILMRALRDTELDLDRALQENIELACLFRDDDLTLGVG